MLSPREIKILAAAGFSSQKFWARARSQQLSTHRQKKITFSKRLVNTMAKKNLRTALASHTAKQAVKAHEKKVEAAQARKADSVKLAAATNGNGKSANKKRKRLSAGGGVGGDTPAAGSASAPSSSASVKGNAKAATINPFSKDDTVLLVGEGDFSYTRALLSPPYSHPANRIVTTSFDAEKSCMEKYPTAAENIAFIRSLATQAGADDPVRFGVDAGDLGKDKMIKKWHEQSGGFNKIYFGFPHVGQGHKDETRNVLANQLLLCRFFVSAAKLLTSGGKPKYALANEQGVKKRKADEIEEVDPDVEDADEDEDVSEGETAFSDLDPEEDLLTGRDSIAEQQQGRRAKATWPPRSPARAGSILITLREAKPYTLWSLPSLATRLTSMLPSVASAAPALPKGLKAPTLADVRASLPEPSVPIPKAKVKGEAQVKPRQKDRGYDTWRSFRFHPSDWHGYKHVRTVGYDERDRDLLSHESGAKAASAVAADAEAVCRMWEFGLRT